MDLENLRRSYEESSLEQSDLHSDPIQQFRAWFQEAQEADSPDWFEINAATLATAADDRVSSRIVLLKQFDENGFVFFTNYNSDKGYQLAKNPNASMVFYWPHVERQIRIEGLVSKTDSATSDRYFHMRPRGSQLGAAASPQSRPIPDRAELVEQTVSLAERFGDDEIPRPDFWGGYKLRADRFEFWQGRPSRLHDRFLYLYDSQNNQWIVSRLAP